MENRISSSDVICSDGKSHPKDCKEYARIEKLVQDLYRTDNKAAYESLKALVKESEENSITYLFFDTFAEMIIHENSYIRTRGLLLIAANAKWDRDNKVDEVIDEYLKHILDEKPITSRQCIQALPQIAQYKEELRESIVEALYGARPERRYAESMWPLVKKDIAKALQEIKRKPNRK